MKEILMGFHILVLIRSKAFKETVSLLGKESLCCLER